MNQLRAVLEAAYSGELRVRDSIDLTVADAACAHLLRCGEQAVCFEFGDASSVVDGGVVPELCRLPYKVCWFEGNALDTNEQPTRVGFLVVEEEAGAWEMLMLARHRNFSYWVLEAEALVPAGMPVGGQFWSGTAEAAPAESKLMVQLCRAFVTALNCCNVGRRQSTPDPALQRARQKRGKLPLFSTWVLVLGNDPSSSGASGVFGDRNGPRVHLRRGHPRQHRVGKWTWVQPHVVGRGRGGSAGMVHKDYRFDPKNPKRPSAPSAGA